MKPVEFNDEQLDRKINSAESVADEIKDQGQITRLTLGKDGDKLEEGEYIVWGN